MGLPPSSTAREQAPGQRAGPLPAGPSWALSSFQPLPPLGQVYIQPAVAQAERRLPTRSVVPSRSLSTLWAPQTRGPRTPEHRKSGLRKQGFPSLRTRRGSFSRAHGSLCLLQATLFLSLPSSPAFQHILPDSPGNGQHSRPQGTCLHLWLENAPRTAEKIYGIQGSEVSWMPYLCITSPQVFSYRKF